jgi:D-alanyl-D-alanine carboxypeptidase
MNLREQQSLFVKLVGTLIDWTYASGYELTFSEAYRSPQEALLNAKSGVGIAASLHCERLAIDLNLFRDGVNLTQVADYQIMGDYWKTLHELARWGGDFASPDADHFSLTYGGIE